MRSIAATAMMLSGNNCSQSLKSWLAIISKLPDSDRSKIKNIVDATVTVTKRSELHKFAVIPRRWVVERSFGWIEKTDDYGKTVKEISIQVDRWWY